MITTTTATTSRNTHHSTEDVKCPRALSARIQSVCPFAGPASALRTAISTIGPQEVWRKACPPIQLDRELPCKRYGAQQARMASRLHQFAADAPPSGSDPGDVRAAQCHTRAACRLCATQIHPHTSATAAWTTSPSDRGQLQEIGFPRGPVFCSRFRLPFVSSQPRSCNFGLILFL